MSHAEMGDCGDSRGTWGKDLGRDVAGGGGGGGWGGPRRGREGGTGLLGSQLSSTPLEECGTCHFLAISF